MPTLAEPRLVQQIEGAPWEIEGYLKVGGYEAWKRCVKELSAAQVIDELKKSGLRGRGGAGFPTGIKWDKVLNHRVKERYFVCNAGEHEPGTFKDRHLLKTLPHQLIEGCLIASFTVQAKASFIYVNHEYHEEQQNLKKALAQAKDRGLLGKNVLGSGVDIELEIFDGHGSYVAGEETAMLESMQGRPAMPRQKPPFYPTDFGLYGKPTLVNNVETLCNIPRILHKGAGWFTQIGTEKCPGTMMFSLSGAVNRPGVYEMPMGVTIHDLIEQCGGGVPNGRKIKAVFPGGPAFSMVTADQLDLPMDFDSLKKAGTGLGSAGVIVVDDATCMVAKTLHFSNFFKNESCGQCPPCRMGTNNLAGLMTQIESGQGTQKDLDSMLQLCGFVKGTGYCTLVTGASVLVQSSLKLFRHEYEDHIRLQRCPYQATPAGVTHS
ncbi:MAG: NADH-quinone oxidoreductase subunit NuoF [Nitrospira sp.]|nr:NADH-quinone oxidoreductase subunit NuoF [Nitrospira sp.]MDH5192434.1 NADH-quinone oxidoreductase subunit NuoF [Nitrospira sp.]